MRISLGVFALCAVSAFADDYVFGFSGGVPHATLVLNGGAFSVSTEVNPINVAHEFNQGWWSGTLSNGTNNTNIFVGETLGHRLNNLFAFDVSGFAGFASSATLEINCSFCLSSGPFPKTYSLWDVSSPLDSLFDFNASPDLGFFTDLGSGINYGLIVFGSNPVTASIPLNAAALARINDVAGVGYFAVGGTLAPAAIPEPGAFALFGMGAAALLGLKQLRKRK